MKNLCIIPARGGSKRFPNKNISILNGKPLVVHTIDAALESGKFDSVIFTSDSEDILEIVSVERGDYPGLKLHKRPDFLATDTSKVIDTVLYYTEMYQDFDTVTLLLPTCPLRDSDDINEAFKKLSDGIDSVISITETEFPPNLSIKLKDDGKICSWHESNPWENGNSRSQDHDTTYRPNGAIYISWMNKFRNNKNFYIGEVLPYFMSREKSIDVDTKFDFELARFMTNQI